VKTRHKSEREEEVSISTAKYRHQAARLQTQVITSHTTTLLDLSSHHLRTSRLVCEGSTSTEFCFSIRSLQMSPDQNAAADLRNGTFRTALMMVMVMVRKMMQGRANDVTLRFQRRGGGAGNVSHAVRNGGGGGGGGGYGVSRGASFALHSRILRIPPPPGVLYDRSVWHSRYT